MNDISFAGSPYVLVFGGREYDAFKRSVSKDIFDVLRYGILTVRGGLSDN